MRLKIYKGPAPDTNDFIKPGEPGYTTPIIRPPNPEGARRRVARRGKELRYSDDQPRDEKGQWIAGSGQDRRLWHLTAHPTFKPDQQHQGGVLHLTDDKGLKFWGKGRLDYGGTRKFAAEILMHRSHLGGKSVVAIPSIPHEWQANAKDAEVLRVVPLAKALKITAKG